MEKYYTPEQLDKLKERKEMFGEKAIHNAEAEWVELFEKYKAEMEKGTDPADECVQKLAKRSQELIVAFTGGDAGIEKSLGRMYQQEEGPQVMAQHGVQLDQMPASAVRRRAPLSTGQADPDSGLCWESGCVTMPVRPGSERDRRDFHD